MKKLFALICMFILCILSACRKEQPSSSEVVPIPPVSDTAHTNPLTGLPAEEDYPYNIRPVAIMIDNIMNGNDYQSSWPQSGMSDADMIFEMETEGGITRYMAIYRNMNRVPFTGPIRSARDQFVQMMLPFSCLFVHDGTSTYAHDMLDRFSYSRQDLVPATGSMFRDLTLYNKGQRAYEHTEYTSGEYIAAAVNNPENSIQSVYTEPISAFDWVYNEEKRVLSGINVNEIAFNFSQSYAAKIIYDGNTGKYYKEHINLASELTKTMVDANYGEKPVMLDNVFILWTQISRYPDGILSDVSLSFGGIGYYFNSGKMEKVRWMKGNPNAPLRIVSLDGKETDIKINPGTSYVAVVSLDYFGTFSLDGELVDAYGDYTPAEEIPVTEGQESNDN